MQSQNLHLTLKKRQGRNQYYDELLAEGVLPLRMMLIPAGTFTMGSPEDEPERRDNEDPQHKVTLSQFFMAKYPVTQAQWRAVTNLPQVKRELNPNPSKFKGDMRPVESVSWYDAVEFCDRLTIKTNRQYRLPTEAEWEYACRAGTTTPFHFGAIITTNFANYRGTDGEQFKRFGFYGNGPESDYREETTPVNQFEGANAFGLYDMHGNVWEWCQDHWHSNYEGAPTDGSAWLTEDKETRRVRRGGSLINSSSYCRSACRYEFEPGVVNKVIGFRVISCKNRENF